MIKRETYTIMSMIQVYYDQFDLDQTKVDLWHEALKIYQLEDLKQNLLCFVRNSHFPPKVSDLVPKASSGHTIPNLDETKGIVHREYQPVSAERIQWHLANMRK